jgi:hypothetical protein
MAAAPGGVPLRHISIDFTVKTSTGTRIEISIPASSTGEDLLAAIAHHIMSTGFMLDVTRILGMKGTLGGTSVIICGKMPLNALDNFNITLVVKLGGSAQVAPSIHPGKVGLCPYCDN